MEIITTLFLGFLLFLPIAGICQDTTGSYLLRKVISMTQYEKQIDGSWKKISSETYSPAGLPELVIYFDNEGKERERHIAAYSATGALISSSAYNHGKIIDTMETARDSSDRVISSHKSVFSNSGGEKLPLHTLFYEYYANGKIKKKSELSGYKSDTSAIYYFDTSGNATHTIWNTSGSRTTLIEYFWNTDRTEMKELHHQKDGRVYNTIVHRYKDNLEVEKIDSLTMRIPFYWKYDAMNRLIETNANVFFTLFLEYDKNGYPTRKTLKNIIFDSGEKPPEKMEYKYEYKFRK